MYTIGVHQKNLWQGYATKKSKARHIKRLFKVCHGKTIFKTCHDETLFKACLINHFSKHIMSIIFQCMSFLNIFSKHVTTNIFLEHFMSNPFQASYPARWSFSLLLYFQLCHDKALFKGCHVKTYQKGQSLTCRPSSRDRTDGEDLRLCLLLESAKTSTMALTVVTKRITPSVMFVDLVWCSYIHILYIIYLYIY